MNSSILDKSIQDFILNYSNPLSKLAFEGSPFLKVTNRELIQQIESRRKIETKLPTWYKNKFIFYPPKINIEQTSSEHTARYKASLISGETLADITGGFGVDTYYFSKEVNAVDHFELNNELSRIAKHNFNILGNKNIHCFSKNGMNTVLKKKYDVVYADPSRRNDKKGKVYLLEDCEPNILKHIPQLLEKSNVLMLKTSPMLDISAGLKELRSVFQIHIVAVNNEVKELIWLLSKDAALQPDVYTINIKNSSSEKFRFQWNTQSETLYDIPLKYLYEPNAAILKSGAFGLLSREFKVKKLQKHSHLYTSNTLQEFPGRRFLITNVIPYTKSSIRQTIGFKKANITTRNFPESVASLRKRWKFNDGGDDYLFFTTLENQKKIVIVCSKVT